MVQHVKFIEDERIVDGKIEKVSGPKFYTVFNLDQTEPV